MLQERAHIPHLDTCEITNNTLISTNRI